MKWVKTTRLTFLVAILLATAVLAYLAAHPELYAGHVSRVVSRNLLRDTGVSFRYENMEGSALGDFRLLGVSASYQGRDGSFAFLTVDTLEVNYDLKTLFQGDIQVRYATVSGARLTLRGASGTLPSPPQKPPGRTPSVVVDNAMIRDLSITIQREGKDPDVMRDIRWRGGVRSRDEGVVIDTQLLRALWVNRDIRVHTARGRTTIGGGGVRLAAVEARTDSSRIRLTGSINKQIELQAEAHPLVMPELYRFLNIRAGPHASLDGVATIKKNDEGIAIAGHIDGTLAGFPFEQMEAGIRLLGPRIAIDHARGVWLGARADMKGQVDTRSGRLQLAGHAESIDLQRHWTGRDMGWPRTDLRGDIDVTLDLKPPRRVQLQLDAAEGTLFHAWRDGETGLPLRELELGLRFDERTGAVVDSLKGRAHDTLFVGTGTVDSSSTLQLALRAEAADLDGWTQHYELPLQGRGVTAEGTLFGPSDRPSLQLHAQLAGLSGYHLMGDHVEADLELAEWNVLDDVRGTVTSDETTFRGHFIGELLTRFDHRKPVTDFHQLELSLGDTTLVTTGRVVEEGESARLEIEQMEFVLSDEVWKLKSPTAVTVAPDWFRCDPMVVQSGSAGWRLRGGVSPTGALDLEMVLDNGELTLLPRLGFGPKDLSGVVAGTVRLGGDVDEPEIHIHVAANQLTGFGRRLERVQMGLDTDGHRVRVDSLLVAGSSGNVDLRGSLFAVSPDFLRRLVDSPQDWRGVVDPIRLDAILRTQQIDPRYWMEPQAGVEDLGRVSGRFALAGTALHPDIDGSVRIDSLLAGPLTVPALVARVRSDGQVLQLAQGKILAPDPWLEFEASLPLRISVLEAPTWDEAAGVTVELGTEGEVDLAPVGRLWPGFSEVSGKLDFHYLATGSMRDPAREGYVEIRDAVAQLKGSLERIREANIDASFDAKGNLSIDDAHAREGMKGQVVARGGIDFVGLMPDDANIEFDADRFLMASIPYLRALVRAEGFRLTLARPAPGLARRPMYSGRVEIIEARYVGEFGQTGGGGALLPTTNPTWLADIHITNPGTVRIQNETANLIVDGDVDFIRDIDGARVRGVVGIPSGRVPIFNNDFTIVSGTLDFSRERELALEPSVRIEAETEVFDFRKGPREKEEVTVILTGTFSSLRPNFTSESGYDEETIVQLLAGVSPDENQGWGDAGIRAGLNFIERGIAREISGIDTVDIETESTSLDQMSGTRVAVGKYLSPNLYLRYSQGLSISERDLFLEYQMSRRLHLSSAVGTRVREAETQATFNVDLKYRVEY